MKKFIPGKTKVQYSGAYYGKEELDAMKECLDEGWFGLSKRGLQFEHELATLIGTRSAVLTNSGSSANLLAVTMLNDYLKKGDEIITPATTFPTTLNPIIQCGYKPVFVDSDVDTFNTNAWEIEKAIGKKTRAVMLPHTLGNMGDMEHIMEIVEEKDLILIEDCCDALGSTYNGKMAGSFGRFSTFSFYPAHHITMGEGGAVCVNTEYNEEKVRSLRDWGRACSCRVCKISIDHNAKCPQRFKSNYKLLPKDYDTKYIYTNMGYNLKPLELQAAMGLVQLKRLPEFWRRRRENFNKYMDAFDDYLEYFIRPTSWWEVEPAWFAFPLTVMDGAGFKRKDILQWLEKHNIENRLMFAGNILRHPAYQNIKCRKVGKLRGSDKIMRDTFFIGIWPGLTEEMTDYVINVFEKFPTGLVKS